MSLLDDQPYSVPPAKRVPGLWQGQIKISDDFDLFPDELMEMMGCMDGAFGP